MPFRRRVPTQADDARAHELSGKIHALGRAGVAASEIARALRVATASVESVLNSPEPERPSVADASPGPALPGPSGLGLRLEEVPAAPVLPNAVLTGPYAISTISDSVFSLLREINVSESLSRGICRRFSNFAPDDFSNLDRILTEAGLSRTARSYVVDGLREQLGISVSAAPKPGAPGPAREEESATARMRRTLQESLELKQLQKMLAEVDRPTESASPEIERLRAENVALKETLRNHELAEALSRQLQPLSDRLGRLEAQSAPAALTKDDVVVRSLDRSLGVIAAKAAETGELRKGLIEAGAPKALLQAAQKVLSTPEERAEMLLPPTPEQMREFARRVEAGERIAGEEATEAPGLIIPGSGRPSRVGPEATGA